MLQMIRRGGVEGLGSCASFGVFPPKSFLAMEIAVNWALHRVNIIFQSFVPLHQAHRFEFNPLTPCLDGWRGKRKL
jgi:hypothetical protein